MSDDPQKFEPPYDESDDYGQSYDDQEKTEDWEADDAFYEPSHGIVTDEEEAPDEEESGGSFLSGGIVRLIVIVVVVIVLLLILARACNSLNPSGTAPTPEQTATAAAVSTQPADVPVEATVEAETPVAGEAVPDVTVEATTAPAAASSGALKPGMRVKVANTDGQGIRFRAGPGTTYVTVTILPEGAILKVASGPEVSDDLNWWRLQADDGAIGWAAEDFLEVLSE